VWEVPYTNAVQFLARVLHLFNEFWLLTVCAKFCLINSFTVCCHTHIIGIVHRSKKDVLQEKSPKLIVSYNLHSRKYSTWHTGRQSREGSAPASCVQGPVFQSRLKNRLCRDSPWFSSIFSGAHRDNSNCATTATFHTLLTRYFPPTLSFDTMQCVPLPMSLNKPQITK
jgi:hypothetical protein